MATCFDPIPSKFGLIDYNVGLSLPWHMKSFPSGRLLSLSLIAHSCVVFTATLDPEVSSLYEALVQITVGDSNLVYGVDSVT